MEMMPANEAMAQLGCDEDALRNYINNGTIRADEGSGELMVSRDDVDQLGGGGLFDDSDDDGTIVLSGDSEDLSLDIGEVIEGDEASAFFNSNEVSQSVDSISFGDDLDVVDFGDGSGQGTEVLIFDEDGSLEGSDEGDDDSLVFTDENDAVDEFSTGEATVTGEATAAQTGVNTGMATAASTGYQTVAFDDDLDDVEDDEPQSSVSGRRSARSQMVRAEAPKTNPIFPIVALLTILGGIAVLVPMGAFDMATTPESYAGENERPLGRATANYLSGLAEMVAGFSPEPDEVNYQGSSWKSIAEANQPDVFHYEVYRGGDRRRTDRWKDFEIDTIEYEDDEQRIPRFAVAEENGRQIRYPLESTSPDGEDRAPQATDVLRPKFSWSGR